jgi:hypothetical protein
MTTIEIVRLIYYNHGCVKNSRYTITEWFSSSQTSTFFQVVMGTILGLSILTFLIFSVIWIICPEDFYSLLK